jgi:hypothetical protein
MVKYMIKHKLIKLIIVALFLSYVFLIYTNQREGNEIKDSDIFFNIFKKSENKSKSNEEEEEDECDDSE